MRFFFEISANILWQLMEVDALRQNLWSVRVGRGERGHKGAAGGGREGGRGLGLGLGMVHLRKVGINNNKLRLICFMMFTLRPESE